MKIVMLKGKFGGASGDCSESRVPHEIWNEVKCRRRGHQGRELKKGKQSQRCWKEPQGESKEKEFHTGKEGKDSKTREVEGVMGPCNCILSFPSSCWIMGTGRESNQPEGRWSDSKAVKVFHCGSRSMTLNLTLD